MSTDKDTKKEMSSAYLPRPSYYEGPKKTRWIVWKDCILDDLQALYTCNMSVAGVCLTGLTFEKSIEWIFEFNERHQYEDKCVFGYHIKTNEGKHLTVPVYLYPGDNRLYNPLYDIVSKHTSERLSECETEIFALIPDVEFPPLPGNAIKYQDTLFFHNVDKDLNITNEAVKSVASVYASTFQDSPLVSLCKVTLGTHYFMYSTTKPNPWWHISGDISSNPLSSLGLRYGRPFIIENAQLPNFLLASDMPMAVYNNPSDKVKRELSATRSLGANIWKWFLIRGLPTGHTSMIAMPERKGDGEVITYNDEFYLVKIATGQLMAINDNGQLFDSSVVINPPDWFSLSPVERRKLVNSSLTTGYGVFSFKPANIKSTYCDNGECKLVDVSKVSASGTYKGNVAYRAPHCWGLCRSGVKPTLEQSDMKTSLIKKPASTAGDKKIEPKKSPLNITAVASVSVAAAIGIALVIYITVVRLKK